MRIVICNTTKPWVVLFSFGVSMSLTSRPTDIAIKRTFDASVAGLQVRAEVLPTRLHVYKGTHADRARAMSRTRDIELTHYVGPTAVIQGRSINQLN